ncbi:MAG: hypothetical protein NTY22_04650 [Proteobacteria bacterium]|nr:hypothetical protein [Pseudomonadota bacterium]
MLTPEIFFETSALRPILDDELLTRSLLKIKDIEYRLIISNISLWELFSYKNTEIIKRRISNLILLWESLGDCKFSIATDYKGCVCKELAKKIEKTPIVSSTRRRKYKHDLYNLLNSTMMFDKDEIAKFEEDKKEMYETDILLQREAKNIGIPEEKKLLEEAKELNLSKEEILQQKAIEREKILLLHLKKYKSLSPDYYLIDDVIVNNRVAGLNMPTKKELLSNLERYKILRTYLMLCEIRMYGNCLSSTNGDPMAQLFRVKEGNWRDLRISCSAAYSKYFVVQDKDCRRICNTLKERGCIDFSSISLDEFQRKFL